MIIIYTIIINNIHIFIANSQQYSISFLERHGRVCCKVLGKQKYQCSHHESLLKSLGVDLSIDSSEIHPQYFCNYCYLSAKKHMCGQQSCTTLIPTQWLPHSETSCTVCDVRRKGGRSHQVVVHQLSDQLPYQFRHSLLSNW